MEPDSRRHWHSVEGQHHDSIFAFAFDRAAQFALGQADPAPAAGFVRQYAAHYRVPPELIAALIDVESRWNPRAVSNKGAMGLMQLMPATAKRYGAFDPFNVEQNIAAGTRYVTALMWEFHGDLRLVSAAYYAGDRWNLP